MNVFLWAWQRMTPQRRLESMNGLVESAVWLFALVVLAVLLSGCRAYRYQPVAQQLYAFDSAGDVRASAGLGWTNAALSIAYSPVKHIAVTAHGSTAFSRAKYERDWSLGYGGGFGFYSNTGTRHSADLFMSADVQRVRSKMLPVHGSGAGKGSYPGNNVVFHLVDTMVHKTYYTIKAQPAYYFALPRYNLRLFVTCAASAVLTEPPHYFPWAPRYGRFAADVLIEPGIGFVSMPMAVAAGFAPVFSVLHDVKDNYAPNAFGRYDKVTKALLYPHLRFYVNVVLTDKMFRKK